jgi:hypothetical protein
MNNRQEYLKAVVGVVVMLTILMVGQLSSTANHNNNKRQCNNPYRSNLPAHCREGFPGRNNRPE